MSTNQKKNFTTTETYKQYQEVLRWNNEFDVKMYNTPIKNPTKKMTDYRHNIIAEEVKELAMGIKNNDIIEIWDAICDILVTVYGALGSFGYKLDLSNIELFESKYADKYNSELRTSIKISDDQMTHIKKYSGILSELLSLLKYYCDKGNLKTASEILHEMVRCAFNCAYYSNLNPNEGLKIVNESNFTKWCDTKEDAMKVVNEYKVGRKIGDKPPKIVKTAGIKLSPLVKDKYIVYCTKTDKILKGNKFKDADFRGYLEENYF